MLHVALRLQISTTASHFASSGIFPPSRIPPPHHALTWTEVPGAWLRRTALVAPFGDVSESSCGRTGYPWIFHQAHRRPWQQSIISHSAATIRLCGGCFIYCGCSSHSFCLDRTTAVFCPQRAQAPGDGATSTTPPPTRHVTTGRSVRHFDTGPFATRSGCEAPRTFASGALQISGAFIERSPPPTFRRPHL